MAAPPSASPKGGSRGPAADGELALRAGVRLVVFDFDLCVLRVHSTGLRILPADVATRDLDKDFTDLAYFRGLVRELVRLGMGVAIASFGSYPTIQAYLNRVFDAEAAGVDAGAGAGAGTGARGGAGAGAGAMPSPLPPTQQIFTRANISTPATVGGRDGFSSPAGKTQQLAALAALYALASPREMLFFDDDDKNVVLAAAAGFCFTVPCPVGLTRASWTLAGEILAGRLTVDGARMSVRGLSAGASAGCAGPIPVPVVRGGVGAACSVPGGGAKHTPATVFRALGASWLAAPGAVDASAWDDDGLVPTPRASRMLEHPPQPPGAMDDD